MNVYISTFSSWSVIRHFIVTVWAYQSNSHSCAKDFFLNPRNNILMVPMYIISMLLAGKHNRPPLLSLPMKITFFLHKGQPQHQQQTEKLVLTFISYPMP